MAKNGQLVTVMIGNIKQKENRMYAVVAVYQDRERRSVWVVSEHQSKFEAEKVCKSANKKSKQNWKRGSYDDPNPSDPDCIITEDAYTIYSVEVA